MIPRWSWIPDDEPDGHASDHQNQEAGDQEPSSKRFVANEPKRDADPAQAQYAGSTLWARPPAAGQGNPERQT